MKIQPPVNLKQIAGIINAKYVGDDDFEVTGINEIHKVEHGDLTFVDSHKYYDKALTSAATTILINKEVEYPEGKALIFSDDPFRDYNILTKHFRPEEYSKKMISASAKIGEGTIIQPGVFIGNHVTIGKNCVLHPGVVI